MSDGDSLAVHFFTLTDARASEHIYMGNLKGALEARGVRPVEEWREADVVHLFEVNFFTREALLGGSVATLLRILRSDTPVVVSTDDLYFVDRPDLTARPELYGLNRRTQRWLFAQADRIVAISESVASALPVDHTEVVRHGVREAYFAETESAERTSAETASTDGDPVVFHASLASKRKNPEAVLEAAERLDARVVLAGGGWDERVPDRLREENVEVRGYVPEAELVEWYHRADVFYFPTRHEGFGLPVLEAMAAGCAVVTTDAYAVPEVAGDAAVLADPEDVDAHVEAIRRLLGDDDARRELSRAAVERAHKFSWSDAAAGTERVYRDVAETFTRSRSRR
jgi:glycosyltransferase involved in cell wall biosynthesis